jgi:hypothetical protein
VGLYHTNARLRAAELNNQEGRQNMKGYEGYTVKVAKGERITLHPEYVSNGRWAVKRAAIKNAALFANADTAKAAFPRCESVNETKYDVFATSFPKDAVPYTATRWIVDADDREYRIFRAKPGVYAAFDRTYLRLFDLDTKYAVLSGVAGNRPFVDAATLAETRVMIMPVQLASFSLDE